MLLNIVRQITIFIRCTKATVLIEFALVIPVLLLLFFGAVEVSRYIFIVQKVESIASTVDDVITQQSTPASLETVMPQLMNSGVSQIMLPYTFGAKGIVIVTDFSSPSGGPVQKNWQCSGGGSLTGSNSQVTYSGTNVTWPGGSMSLGSNGAEESIVTEVFYKFVPMLASGVISPVTIYRVTSYNPRIGYSPPTNLGLTSPIPTTVAGDMTCN